MLLKHDKYLKYWIFFKKETFSYPNIYITKGIHTFMHTTLMFLTSAFICDVNKLCNNEYCIYNINSYNNDVTGEIFMLCRRWSMHTSIVPYMGQSAGNN